MEKAVLVTVVLRDRQDAWKPEDSKNELRELAISAGLTPVSEEIVSCARPHPAYLIGRGKASEIGLAVKKYRAAVVVLSHDLSPSQQRNLEDVLGCKTIDRTQLILDIFARRARSQEGKVQVELAQLSYLLPRLAGQGIYLSRLGGGIGTRGPGEQKLEMDRRRIRERIHRLEGELGKLAERRQSYRLKRREGSVPTIALVGYTNAGKSTLFNALTEADVFVQDRLFSTLDPTVRSLVLPNRQKILLVDTVGFLHLLPHHLIDAFKATLEEVGEADLLLHVLDVTRPDARVLEQSVNEVLVFLGADSKRTITVLNKAEEILRSKRALEAKQNEWPRGVFVSALNREGLADLAASIQKEFDDWRAPVDLYFPRSKADLLSRLYEEGEVMDRRDAPEGVYVKARLSPKIARSIAKRLKG